MPAPTATPQPDPAAHPILRATADLAATLKSVADVNPAFMGTGEKATALTELVRLEAQVGELKLRILADAGDVAERTAERDPAAWLAHHARVRHEDARADHRLARSLDRRHPALAAAMRDGLVNTAQATVIVRGLDALPDEVTSDVLALAEDALVGYAERFGPRQLARLARRILDVVAPQIAEEAEARHLAALEEQAHRRTRLALRRVGDGTTRISGLLPDAAATRLATYLEAFTSPRQQRSDADEPHEAADGAPDDPFTRLPYPRRLGEAFCQLLEALDPRRLPLHGGDATTVVVTVTLEQLRRELGVAELGGAHVPGDEPAGDGLTAGQARRLACTARVVPAVLGGDSEVLDLGRSRRLFTAAQRRALLLRDRTCRAEGCDVPGTWCEAHHWLPWSRGGPTDLGHGVLLCSHHHHRAHDPAYASRRLSNGDVRYARRT